MRTELVSYRNKSVMISEKTAHLLNNTEGAKVINLASYSYRRAIIARNEALAKMRSNGWVNQCINWCSDFFGFKK